MGGRKETLVGALLGAEKEPIPGQAIILPAGHPFALSRGADYPCQFLGQRHGRLNVESEAPDGGAAAYRQRPCNRNSTETLTVRDRADVTEWPHGITETAHWDCDMGSAQEGQCLTRATPAQREFPLTRRRCTHHGAQFLRKQRRNVRSVTASHQRYPFGEQLFLTSLYHRNQCRCRHNKQSKQKPGQDPATGTERENCAFSKPSP